jgi:uncharacterized protein (DUF362 family)
VVLRYGDIIVEQSMDDSIFENVVSGLDLVAPVIIKPNWGTINNYTEASVIDRLLSAIDGEAIVTESYGWARTEDALKGRGAGSKRRDFLRKSDKWFLDKSGVGDVLQKHGVEYLNVTEEAWAGRTVDPDVIKGHAKSYRPILFETMYAQVPTRLYELRHGTFLSLAKYRLNHEPIVVSLSLKNLFGMIPGPSRGKYHGKNDAKLAQTIVDINKIYHSIFKVKGIVDAFYTASIGKDREDAINPHVAERKGLLIGGSDCVRLDAFVACLEGKDPNAIEYLNLASKTFGSWTENDLGNARSCGVSVFR